MFSFLKYYFSIVFILLNLLYKRCSIYYKPLLYKDPKTGKIINVDNLYAPFQVKDKLTYWKFILYGMIFFIPKSLLCTISVISLILNLKILHIFYKDTDTNLHQRNCSKKIIKFWCYLFLCGSTIKIKKIESPNIKVIYTKYLGSDYNFEDQTYSLITSNHIGFFDVILVLYLYQPGFIAKKMVQDYPFFGSVAKGINCLFVDRESETARKKIMDDIYIRQKNYMEKKSLTPLAIFAEGTTTSNRHILKFKKGAFYHLLPIKPQIIKIDQNCPLHIACGVQNIFFHTMKIMTYPLVEMGYFDLPVIRPTEFMFQRYANLGKNKWEIFAEVTRKIYCEIGGFQESNYGFRDVDLYERSVLSGKYEPNLKETNEENENINDKKNI